MTHKGVFPAKTVGAGTTCDHSGVRSTHSMVTSIGSSSNSGSVPTMSVPSCSAAIATEYESPNETHGKPRGVTPRQFTSFVHSVESIRGQVRFSGFGGRRYRSNILRPQFQ